MKKALHYILSYLGAFLFFSGIVGCSLKWCINIMDLNLYFANPISSIITLLLGAIITIKIYHPLKYQ